MSTPGRTGSDENGQQTPEATGSQPSTPGVASTAASATGAASRSSMTMSPGRPPYIPQFTAATQMILNRMKGESTSLTSALSTARSTINQTAYEDTKRQLLARMSTSVGMTMQMPTPPRPTAIISSSSSSAAATATAIHKSASSPASTPIPTARSSAAGMSAIRKISAGLTPRGKPKAPPAPSGPPPAKKQRLANGSNSGGRTGRRKRGGKSNNNNDDSGDSSLGSDSDSESKSAAAPTKTKSGRQVTKPTTYNPSAMEGSTRKRYGKRTAEQAMCKRCTRLAWNDSNQMVFCDGCEAAWHERCHEPEIDPSVVADASAKWFCAECAAKREKAGGKKSKAVETAASSPATAAAPPMPSSNTKSTWPGRTAGQKRAYLTGLSQAELISIIMTSIEQHPDQAIFPPDDGPAAATMPRSLFAGSTTEGLFSRVEANPTGPINYIRKIPAAAAAAATSNTTGSFAKRFPVKIPGTPFDPDEEDPTGLMEAWPKPGHGMYHRLLAPDWEDETLVEDDYEAFSHIRYDDKGNKVWENGVLLNSEGKK